MAKQWELRAKLLKEENLLKTDTIKRATGMLVYILLARSAKHMKSQYYEHFAKIDRDIETNKAAGIITRIFRLHSFRKYREEIRGAISMMGAYFVLKVKLWRMRRKNKVSERALI